MSKETIIMDFSGIYKEENFLGERDCQWLDFTKLEGVNCYCTEEAEQEIKKQTEAFSCKGIHFLDSGNYHYLSKFWLEKIKEPFSLLVFDNHTDMQESAFFGLLSCGSWVKEVLETNANLRDICIIGPSGKLFSECDAKDLSRVTAIAGEEIGQKEEEILKEFLEKGRNIPLYLSIDKDVLCQEDARTNWDQGEVTLLQLETWIKTAFKNRRILGADICGENPQDTALPPKREDLEINSRTNEKLLELLETEFQKQN